MSDYRVHTIDSAPAKSRPALADLGHSFGFIPNVAGAMAESPVLIQGFIMAFHNFHAGSFTNAQRQTLLLSNAVTNRCAWAVAFHSALALREGVDAADVKAIRERRAPREPRLAALSAVTRALIEQRGHLDDHELSAFHEAGFGPAQVLEVIAGLAASVMTNYAGNITRPALEPAFAAQVWSE
jgi:AhpD family alkylhydroperoxidase